MNLLERFNTVNPIDIGMPFEYFPDCRYSLVELMANKQFSIKDFHQAYCWHSFEYTMQGSQISHADDVQLNITLDRKMRGLLLYKDGIDTSPIAENIQRRYGVQIHKTDFQSFDAYVEYLLRSLKKGEPVLSTYSLGYVPTRRHYKKVFGLHSICIVGYNAEHQSFDAIEQAKKPKFSISKGDLFDCFHYLLKEHGACSVFHLEQTHQPKPYSELDFLEMVEFNISNLSDTCSSYGLTCLKKFIADLGLYLESKPEKPIFIPGSWVFSHERISAIRFIESYVTENPQFGESFSFESLTTVLQDLHDKWLAIDFYSEMGLQTNSNKFNQPILEILNSILVKETEALELWRSLSLCFERARQEAC
ncbi:BtrH N-terminal domain-containing protein [Vibrio ouci]|uniref:Uncharacterized protein n=1 Tax=Vibrio ouci TaxID=2499078 RepID=A0A4Y8WHH7_9VIBR|nr:BtrH N-terminal domain-containing protein [Vibrio ouci]TFH92400.1 hypothetical protein ELS82_06970 [Vibrio ouci]